MCNIVNLYKQLILKEYLVHPARFELTTSAFGGQRIEPTEYAIIPQKSPLRKGYSQIDRQHYALIPTNMVAIVLLATFSSNQVGSHEPSRNHHYH